MKTKKKMLIIIIICLILLVGAFVVDAILGKSYFNELKYEELMTMIENKDDAVVLISQTGCTHCISYKPKLKKIAKEYEVNIYYIDVDLLEEEQTNELKKHISFLKTPVTVFLKDGKETTVANRIEGNAPVSEVKNKLKSNGFIK